MFPSEGSSARNRIDATIPAGAPPGGPQSTSTTARRLVGLRRFWRTTGPAEEPLRLRDAATMLLLYLVVVLAWCAALTGLEAAMGLTLRTGGGLASPGNYLDAIWHLATALVIAAPLRNRRLLLLLPLLSLGLDVDHVFGAYLPAPFPREAHDIVFLLIASAALYAIAGRFLAGASASAWTTHVAVDGGAFPLLAPFASTAYVLPFPAVVFGIALAAAVAFAAARPIRAATDAREAVPIIVTVAALAVTLYFVAPGFRGFTGA